MRHAVCRSKTRNGRSMMTTYPKRPVAIPQAILCDRNGYLPKSRLHPIGLSGELEVTAARAWTALWWDLRTVGLDLTWTFGGTYRAYWQQVSLFLQRWDNVRRNTESEFYGGQQWWLKPGVARAAVPGSSNHGLGLAVDVASGTTPTTAKPISAAALARLLDVAEAYGWSWESDKEPWHIHYWRGDDIPGFVIDAEAEIVAAGGS